ncbi:glycosyltransferase family 4 protein [Metabacillus dongyingensis]|uniref:glycosyltransferase family 4 protein n=1 Tax=Metabacillus dongyingensis TaxID=2874282 RepID=UPI003B8E0879
MKILMVGPTLKLKGGISSVLSNYFSYKNEFNDKQAEIDGFNSINTKNKLTQMLAFPSILAQFFIKIKDYDIIHIHVSSYGSFIRKNILAKICKINKKPYVVHLHGSEFKLFYNNSSKKRKNSIKVFFDSASKIIVLGEEWKQFIGGIVDDSNKIYVLNNAVPLPERQSYEKKVNNKKLILGFLGQIGERKGIFDLINSVDSFSNEVEIELLIAGNGEQELLQKKILAANNKHRFINMGWINNLERQNFLNSIDVLVLPSYNEGLPMSILEAMSYKKPIISTNVGSIEEAVLNDINGFIINPGNQEQLSQAIYKFLNNPAIIEEFGSKSIKIFVEKFLLQTHIDKLCTLYREIKGRE